MLRILLACPDAAAASSLRRACQTAVQVILPPVGRPGQPIVKWLGQNDDDDVDLLISAEPGVQFVRTLDSIRPRPTLAVLVVDAGGECLEDLGGLSACDEILHWPCAEPVLQSCMRKWIGRIRESRRREQLEAQLDQAIRENSTLRRLVSRQERLIKLRERHDGSLRQIVGRVDGITRMCQQIIGPQQDGQAPLSISQIVELCMQRVPPLLGVRLASLYLHDSSARVLRLGGHNHPYPINKIVLLDKRPNSPMAMAVQRRQLLMVSEPVWGELTADAVTRPYAHRYATSNCVIAPLLAAGQVVGVLNLADRIDDLPFDDLTDLLPIRQLVELLGVSIRNIELYEAVRRQARCDGMTGLANHGAFMHELVREINRARRYGTPLSLILADVDSLKRINDVLGHVAGDKALIMVARQVLNSIRDSDFAARYGGDEFAILLPSSPLASAQAVADRLIAAISAVPIAHELRSAPVTVSIGVGQYEGQISAEQFVEQVDRAMYRAKHDGKNRVAAGA